MSDFTTIMSVVDKPNKRMRKEKPTTEEVLFLDQVRSVRLSVIHGQPVVVVTETERSFEDVFKQYTSVMKLYDKRGLITLKSLDKVTASDLDKNIVEIH
ncbi:TPA: hypothetical protein MCM29_005038 [Klebsiella pneumoniae]|nr:hypothetical protein vBKpMFBKp34_200 [Klebsiella phage vB_KpM_FBKp34]UYL04344.1 hypothetical protein EPNKCIFM_00023 [Klebsiella phage KP13-16]HBT0444868.1 hypothetical protein [Klebsiella pneumoniae]HBT8980299.1 hypothetical protein [Klebsiella pneumoniae]